jgi:hypothetical protein
MFVQNICEDEAGCGRRNFASNVAEENSASLDPAADPADHGRSAHFRLIARNVIALIYHREDSAAERMEVGSRQFPVNRFAFPVKAFAIPGYCAPKILYTYDLKRYFWIALKFCPVNSRFDGNSGSRGGAAGTVRPRSIWPGGGGR